MELSHPLQENKINQKLQKMCPKGLSLDGIGY